MCWLLLCSIQVWMTTKDHSMTREVDSVMQGQVQVCGLGEVRGRWESSKEDPSGGPGPLVQTWTPLLHLHLPSSWVKLTVFLKSS